MGYIPVPNAFQQAVIPVAVSQVDANFSYLASKLISVRDYGAVGDGVTDDTAAFQAAAAAIRLAGTGTLRLEPARTYKLFTGIVAQTFALDFSACTNIWVQGNGATITSGLTDTTLDADLIYANATNGIRVTDVKFVGGNTQLWDGDHGEKFLRYLGGCRNIAVENVDIRNCYGGVVCLVGDSSVRNHGVKVANAYFDRAFYPVSPQNTDDVEADFVTDNGGRAYFIVGPAANHRANVDSQQAFTSADVNITILADPAKSEADNTVENIRINYRSKGRWPGSGSGPAGSTDATILLKAKQATGSTGAAHFRDIHINFCVDASSASDKFGRIVGMSRNDSANNADASVRGHTFDDIVISGSARNWANAVSNAIVICDDGGGLNWTGDSVRNIALRDVAVFGVPAGGANAIYVSGQGAVSGVPFLTASNVRCDGPISYVNATNAAIAESNVSASNRSVLSTLWKTYTPGWQCSVGPNPSIGNGSIYAAWRQDGRDAVVDLWLVPGSSTTFGGGGYYTLGLPLVSFDDGSGNRRLGSAEAFESGVAWHQGSVAVINGQSVVTLNFGLGADWGPATPWTFKNGDFVRFTLRYPIVS